MRSTIHKRISDINASEWNALTGTEIPFLRHEFLAALEHTGCIGSKTGWEPRYVTLTDEKGLAAAAPAFAKTHSYGEFVFDFAWAQAYARVGRNYYPKLTVAVPFTPATSSRLLIRPDLDLPTTSAKLIEAVQDYSAEHALSSAHALFLDEAGRVAYEQAGWLMRRDCQFHWSNRNYASFDAFLDTFTADKRKKARRERRRVAEAGVTFDTLTGKELDGRLIDRLYAFHRDTFLRHGRDTYLTRGFFAEIARTLGDAMMIKVARHQAKPIAAAIFFKSDDALFGRYWGADPEYHLLHSLHFETCYHQGVEYCIEQGLQRFDPGTQGEHKVARGFEPTLTWSAHYIADRRFRAAIEEYLGQEAEAIDQYAAEVREHVPYR